MAKAQDREARRRKKSRVMVVESKAGAEPAFRYCNAECQSFLVEESDFEVELSEELVSDFLPESELEELELPELPDPPFGFLA